MQGYECDTKRDHWAGERHSAQARMRTMLIADKKSQKQTCSATVIVPQVILPGSAMCETRTKA